MNIAKKVESNVMYFKLCLGKSKVFLFYTNFTKNKVEDCLPLVVYCLQQYFSLEIEAWHTQ